MINDGKEDRLLQQPIHGKGATICATSFASTVLTFEGIPIPSILKVKSSCPVYAHHVILCPLNRMSITTTSTTVFSPATSWAKISKLPSGKTCCVSGTMLPSLQLAQFLSEIEFRKKYGPVAHLHWTMLRKKLIPTPVQWRLIRTTSYSTQLPVTMRSLHFTLPTNSNLDLYNEAKDQWMDMLTNNIAHIAFGFEPIVID